MKKEIVGAHAYVFLIELGHFFLSHLATFKPKSNSRMRYSSHPRSKAQSPHSSIEGFQWQRARLTHDIIHVKELLGHMRIDNTMVCKNLETAIFASKNDQFYAIVVNTPDEAIKLIETGFDHVTGEYNDGGKLFKKRK